MLSPVASSAALHFFLERSEELSSEQRLIKIVNQQQRRTSVNRISSYKWIDLRVLNLMDDVHLSTARHFRYEQQFWVRKVCRPSQIRVQNCSAQAVPDYPVRVPYSCATRFLSIGVRGAKRSDISNLWRRNATLDPHLYLVSVTHNASIPFDIMQPLSLRVMKSVQLIT